LPAEVVDRAADVAGRFLRAVGFSRGLFNLEFFYDAASDRLTIIEVNPRMASQFSDLYRRVLGLDPHRMSLALALGLDPALLPRSVPQGGAAASLVYRAFRPGATPAMPTATQQAAVLDRFADALLFTYPKSGHSLARDFKWLGSHRYGILHLHGDDPGHLRAQCISASALLGWKPPYADCLEGHLPDALTPAASPTSVGPGPAHTELQQLLPTATR
jgi:hypothetical protein